MLNVRMEKRTSELESTSIEIIYFKEQRKKRRLKKNQIDSETCEKVKHMLH